jgi:hypothetical protein
MALTRCSFRTPRETGTASREVQSNEKRRRELGLPHLAPCARLGRSSVNLPKCWISPSRCSAISSFLASSEALSRPGPSHQNPTAGGRGQTALRAGGTMTALGLARAWDKEGKTIHILERGTWWTTRVSIVQDKEVSSGRRGAVLCWDLDGL